jgi:hypothetical protein
LIGLHQRAPRALNPVLAAISGALLALVIGYACSYVLTRYGMGVVGGRGDRVFGPGVFARSGLNLCALQHMALVGVGEVTDTLGNTSKLTASIVLPMTVWVVVPIVSLMIGGWCAARSRALGGRRAMTGAAVAGGLLYGIALAIAARWVEARLDTFLLPEISGISANPPQIAFRPSERSALVLGCGFGTVFSYLGALIAARSRARASAPGKWWACGKAVVVTALVVELLIACAVFVFAVARRNAEAESNPRIVEMLPTAAGLGYAMIYGATLVSSVESGFLSQKTASRPFYVEINAYGGVTRENEHKVSPVPAWVGCLVVGIVAAFVSGRLAVRWGSRDGSLPTAWRTALLHTAYVALLAALCGMLLRQADPVSSTTLQVGAHFGGTILISFGGVLLFSFLGAHTANKRRLQVPIS